MRIILTWLTDDVVCQAADRKLTGSSIDNVFNKQTCVEGNHGRLAISFTGLGYIGPVPPNNIVHGAPGYRTDEWISDVAINVLADGGDVGDLSSELHRTVTYWINDKYNSKLKANQKFLSVVLAGFINGKPVSLEISNAEGAMSGNVCAAGIFRITHHNLRSGKLYVHGARGAWTGPLRFKGKKLTKHVNHFWSAGDRSEEASRLILCAASSSEAKGLIGRNIVGTEIHQARHPAFDSVYLTEDKNNMFDYAPNVV